MGLRENMAEMKAEWLGRHEEIREGMPRGHGYGDQTEGYKIGESEQCQE